MARWCTGLLSESDEDDSDAGCDSRSEEPADAKWWAPALFEFRTAVFEFRQPTGMARNEFHSRRSRRQEMADTVMAYFAVGSVVNSTKKILVDLHCILSTCFFLFGTDNTYQCIYMLSINIFTTLFDDKRTFPLAIRFRLHPLRRPHSVCASGFTAFAVLDHGSKEKP